MNELLKQHGYTTRTSNGQLQVLECWYATRADGSFTSTTQWITCQHWTDRQLLNWIGY